MVAWPFPPALPFEIISRTWPDPPVWDGSACYHVQLLGEVIIWRRCCLREDVCLHAGMSFRVDNHRACSTPHPCLLVEEHTPTHGSVATCTLECTRGAVEDVVFLVLLGLALQESHTRPNTIYKLICMPCALVLRERFPLND